MCRSSGTAGAASETNESNPVARGWTRIWIAKARCFASYETVRKQSSAASFGWVTVIGLGTLYPADRLCRPSTQIQGRTSWASTSNVYLAHRRSSTLRWHMSKSCDEKFETRACARERCGCAVIVVLSDPGRMAKKEVRLPLTAFIWPCIRVEGVCRLVMHGPNVRSWTGFVVAYM